MYKCDADSAAKLNDEQAIEALAVATYESVGFKRLAAQNGVARQRCDSAASWLACVRGILLPRVRLCRCAFPFSPFSLSLSLSLSHLFGPQHKERVGRLRRVIMAAGTSTLLGQQLPEDLAAVATGADYAEVAGALPGAVDDLLGTHLLPSTGSWWYPAGVAATARVGAGEKKSWLSVLHLARRRHEEYTQQLEHHRRAANAPSSSMSPPPPPPPQVPPLLRLLALLPPTANAGDFASLLSSLPLVSVCRAWCSVEPARARALTLFSLFSLSFSLLLPLFLSFSLSLSLPLSLSLSQSRTPQPYPMRFSVKRETIRLFGQKTPPNDSVFMLRPDDATLNEDVALLMLAEGAVAELAARLRVGGTSCVWHRRNRERERERERRGRGRERPRGREGEK
jgi:hypothetical protein